MKDGVRLMQVDEFELNIDVRCWRCERTAHDL
jgi:hypothetical protein